MASNDLTFKIVVDSKTGEASLKAFGDSAKKAGDEAKGAGGKAETAGKQGNAAGKSFETGWINAAAKISVIQGSISMIGGVLKSTFGAPLENLVEMEQSLHNVGSLSDEIANNYDKVYAALKKQSAVLPVKSTKQLADAMYQATSAGYGMSDALKLVEWAGKGSVAGMATIPESMNALLSLMQGFQWSGKDASKAMDLMFQTVRKGLTTFPELAASLSNVSAKASTAGISAESLMASLATITSYKINTSEAVTKIARLIPEAQKLGIDFKKTNLQDAAVQIAKMAGGLDKISESSILSSSEAKDAVIFLAQNTIKSNQHLLDMQNSAGAAQKAFKANVDTTGNSIQLMENRIRSFKQAIIKPFYDSIRWLVDGVSGYLDKWLSLPGPIKIVASAVTALTSAFVALKITGLMPAVTSMLNFGKGLTQGILSNFTILQKMAYSSVGAFRAFQTAISGVAIGGFGLLLNYLPDILKYFSSVFASVKKFEPPIDVKVWKEDFEAAKQEQQSFNDTINPLLEEYNQLNERVKNGEQLSKEETEKYVAAKKKIAEVLPDAVLWTNEETGAIELSSNVMGMASEKSNEYMLKTIELNNKLKEAISNTAGQLKDIRAKMSGADGLMNLFSSEETIKRNMELNKAQYEMGRMNIIKQIRGITESTASEFKKSGLINQESYIGYIKSLNPDVSEIDWKINNYELYNIVKEQIRAVNSKRIMAEIKNMSGSADEILSTLKNKYKDLEGQQWYGITDLVNKYVKEMSIEKIPDNVMPADAKQMRNDLLEKYNEAVKQFGLDSQEVERIRARWKSWRSKINKGLTQKEIAGWNIKFNIKEEKGAKTETSASINKEIKQESKNELEILKAAYENNDLTALQYIDELNKLREKNFKQKLKSGKTIGELLSLSYEDQQKLSKDDKESLSAGRSADTKLLKSLKDATEDQKKIILNKKLEIIKNVNLSFKAKEIDKIEYETQTKNIIKNTFEDITSLLKKEEKTFEENPELDKIKNNLNNLLADTTNITEEQVIDISGKLELIGTKEVSEDIKNQFEIITKVLEAIKGNLKTKAVDFESEIENIELRFKIKKIDSTQYLKELKTGIENLYNKSLETIKKATKEDNKNTLDPVNELLQKSLNEFKVGDNSNQAILNFENLIQVLGVDNVKKILGEDFTKLVEALKKGKEAFNKEWDNTTSSTEKKNAFFKQILESGLGAVQTSITNMFTAGFGKEGFKSLGKGLVDGFKGILMIALEYLEKELIIGKAASLVEALLNPLAIIKSVPLAIAAEAGIILARAAVSSWNPTFFATGGLIENPTLALMGEAGTELVAPKKDFLTIAREIVNREVQVTNNNYSKQRIDINISGALRGDGRDMLAVINTQTKLNNLRKL